MRKIKFYVGTTMVGSKVTHIQEFDDDITNEEIEEFLKEWVWENINADFEEIPE